MDWNKKIKLRKLKTEDAEPMLAWMKNPDIYKNILIFSVYSHKTFLYTKSATIAKNLSMKQIITLSLSNIVQ